MFYRLLYTHSHGLCTPPPPSWPYRGSWISQRSLPIRSRLGKTPSDIAEPNGLGTVFSLAGQGYRGRLISLNKEERGEGTKPGQFVKNWEWRIPKRQLSVMRGGVERCVLCKETVTEHRAEPREPGRRAVSLISIIAVLRGSTWLTDWLNEDGSIPFAQFEQREWNNDDMSIHTAHLLCI